MRSISLLFTKKSRGLILYLILAVFTAGCQPAYTNFFTPNFSVKTIIQFLFLSSLAALLGLGFKWLIKKIVKWYNKRAEKIKKEKEKQKLKELKALAKEVAKAWGKNNKNDKKGKNE